MKSKEQVEKVIYEYRNEYMDFMKIDSFPEFKIEIFEVEEYELFSSGFETAAQALYDTKTGEYTLRICTNFNLIKCIIFHEFTHILDTEMYAKKDPRKYLCLSGYTEFHASQVELMVLLGQDSIYVSDCSFSLDHIINIGGFKTSVEEYLYEKHQFVVNMMSRTDFPAKFETLKATLGVLYNYFGLRSICKMYSKNYVEKVDNTAIIKFIPLHVFSTINIIMNGWLDAVRVENSFGPYYNAIMPLVREYKLL